MEVLTTSEAVRQFQMHPATVLRLILTQRVTAHKNSDGKWLIRRSDLECWNRQRVRRAPKQEQGTEAAHA
jgi:hypothetical protein